MLEKSTSSHCFLQTRLNNYWNFLIQTTYLFPCNCETYLKLFCISICGPLQCVIHNLSTWNLPEDAKPTEIRRKLICVYKPLCSILLVNASEVGCQPPGCSVSFGLWSFNGPDLVQINRIFWDIFDQGNLAFVHNRNIRAHISDEYYLDPTIYCFRVVRPGWQRRDDRHVSQELHGMRGVQLNRQGVLQEK